MLILDQIDKKASERQTLENKPICTQVFFYILFYYNISIYTLPVTYPGAIF